MPTVTVSTKHPGGRWRTGRQFGPDDKTIDVTEDELRRLLDDPVLRVVPLEDKLPREKPPKPEGGSGGKGPGQKGATAKADPTKPEGDAPTKAGADSAPAATAPPTALGGGSELTASKK
jgi:hypothetical protein